MVCVLLLYTHDFFYFFSIPPPSRFFPLPLGLVHVLPLDDLMFTPLPDTAHIFFSPSPVGVYFPPTNSHIELLLVSDSPLSKCSIAISVSCACTVVVLGLFLHLLVSFFECFCHVYIPFSDLLNSVGIPVSLECSSFWLPLSPPLSRLPSEHSHQLRFLFFLSSCYIVLCLALILT